MLDNINEIFDISPKINSSIAVFPGDVAYTRHISLSQEHKNDHLDLSSITTTLHLGAHADAPLHYGKGAESIDQRSLYPYLGRCQVVETKAPYGGRILPEHFDIGDIYCTRVLFKTKSFNPYEWTNQFNSLSPETIEALVEKSVQLVGIDTPSVDPWDSKLLESHKSLLKNNVSVLEGLDLFDIKPGEYQLIALPLRLEDAEASPVRAILFK